MSTSLLLAWALDFAFAAVGLSLALCTWRLLRGPLPTDRVLALDTMAINMIALLTLFGMDRGTAMYFEATLLFAMVGFISTVAYAKFVLRGDIIE